MANKICWHEIGVSNMDNAKAFYGELFDWDIKEDEQMSGYHMAYVEEKPELGIFKVDEEQGMKPYCSYYISVDDLAASVEKAKELGATIIVPPTELPMDMGSFAMFMDPDQNVLGIWQEKEK